MKLQPLAFLEPGSQAVIRQLSCGRTVCHRLTEEGLHCGTKVGVIKNDNSGPLILSLGGGRLALGRGMSMKILVEKT